ncbi:RNA polymerase sigma factor [Microbacterium sp. A588]
MSAADKQAHFEVAIRDCEGDLVRYFLRRIPNPADAAEAHGELLITAWKLHRKMPADATEARMWLFGVAHNVLRSTRRNCARHSAAVQRFADELRTTPKPQPEDKGVELRDAIASLPAGEAELVRLVYWDGFRSHEAAAVLGINASTARSRMAKAKAQLRALMEPAKSVVADAAYISR